MEDTAGMVFLVPGPYSGERDLDATATRLDGEVGSVAGYALALVDDREGDGRPELAIGAPGDEGGGPHAEQEMFPRSQPGQIST